MKKFLFAAASILALSSAARAADVSSCSEEWSGVYIGLHAGGAFGTGNTTPVKNISISGPIAGGLVGWNWQNCDWVFGIEGDMGFSPDSVTGSIQGTKGGVDDFDVEPNGHIRLRAGWANGSVMPFIAGGLAIADADVRYIGVPGAADTKLHFGFTIGAGVDFALNSNWIIRAEYLYDNYGSENYNAPIGKVDFDTHTIRAAVIYKF
jgi:outer membrane immunogenic protein